MTEPGNIPRALRRQQWLEQIDAAQRRGDMASAARLAVEAVADGVETPGVFNLAASARYGEGRYEEAVALLKRGRALAPRDPHLLNALGLSLKALGRFDAAADAFDAAVAAEPRYAPAHYNKGA